MPRSTRESVTGLHRLPDADKETDRSSAGGRPGPRRNQRPGSGGPGQPRRPRIPAWVIAILFLGLVAYQLYAFFGPKQDEGRTVVPYSAVEDQVRSGNVEAVTLTNTRIEADLKNEIAWNRTAEQVAESGGSAPNGAVVRTDKLRATLPPVENPELLPLLQQQGVEVNAETGGDSLLTSLFLTLLPFLLIVGLIIFMGRQMSRGQ